MIKIHTMKKIWLIIAVVLLASCGKDTDKLVKIQTPKGDMMVLLYEETPRHKANFLELAESGEYDSTIFHRVIENFMIQGGDIYRDQPRQEPESERLDAEIVDKFIHKKGALAAARQGNKVNPEKKSSGCQFYIVQGRVWTEKELTTDQAKLNQTLSEMFALGEYDSLQQEFVALQKAKKFDAMNKLALEKKAFVEKEMGVDLTEDIEPERLEAYTTVGGVPHLDGQYTIFGRVVEGLDVIDKIASVRTQRDKPRKNIYVTMEIIEMPRSEVTEKYGYQYP